MPTWMWLVEKSLNVTVFFHPEYTFSDVVLTVFYLFRTFNPVIHYEYIDMIKLLFLLGNLGC